MQVCKYMLPMSVCVSSLPGAPGSVPLASWVTTSLANPGQNGTRLFSPGNLGNWPLSTGRLELVLAGKMEQESGGLWFPVPFLPIGLRFLTRAQS